MYYNCGIAVAKRQTKLKLHFVIQSVCPRGPENKTDYGFPWSRGSRLGEGGSVLTGSGGQVS